MSPAPRDPNSNHFSNRIRTSSLVSEDWPTQDASSACVWAVSDQLLFARSVSPAPAPGTKPTPLGERLAALLGQEGVAATHLASLFDGLRGSGGAEDFDLVQLALPAGTDVFGLTQMLRDKELAGGNERAVSPNHIVIPASVGDSCPYGAPRQYDGEVPPPPGALRAEATRGPRITLLDSGYLDWLAQGWGANVPLDTLLGHVQLPAQQGFWPGPSGWEPCPPELPDADGDGSLDALAGHANFVAGVLAQRCDQPEIAIWDLNASFVADDLSQIPTEAGMLHTLLRSQLARPTPVIVVVFAFPAFGSVLGAHWDGVFAELRSLNHDFVLVAPTGNQGQTIRRYPAALGKPDPSPPYPSAFLERGVPEVIGVASLSAEPPHVCSSFSNRGRPPSLDEPGDPWVTCAAVGEEVVSTFLRLDLRPEDDPWPLGAPLTPYDFAAHHSWALWQGTSFATPKVAAAIANELHAHPHALAAWRAVAGGAPSDPELGVRLGGL